MKQARQVACWEEVNSKRVCTEKSEGRRPFGWLMHKCGNNTY
jgi:hypothetical protein